MTYQTDGQLMILASKGSDKATRELEERRDQRRNKYFKSLENGGTIFNPSN